MDDDELWPGDFFSWSCLSSSCLHQQLGDPGGDAEAEEYLNHQAYSPRRNLFQLYLECHSVIADNSAHTRIPKTVCLVITIIRYL